MVAAMIIGTRESEWPQQSDLIVVYAFIALCAVALAFSPFRHGLALRRLEPFAFTVIDVVALTVFQLLSTNGIYPLLIMTMLPILLGLDVSSRRAAVVLILSMVGFAIAVLQDPAMIETIGWFEAIFRFVLYGFLCATAFVAVRIAERHTRAVAGLSVLREELLAQTMTASDVLQRRISESIHDGPLQDILAVRQESSSWRPHCPATSASSVRWPVFKMRHKACGRRLSSCIRPFSSRSAWEPRCISWPPMPRSVRASRSPPTSITRCRNEIDPIVFGVVRELLSNVVHHSRAEPASVTLGVTATDVF